MTWEYLVSGIALSSIVLVPLCIKWEIPRRIGVPSSLFIGLVTGLIASGVVGIFPMKSYQILVLELFLIIGISASLLFWRFFRDPERIAPEDENTILSPADGKVIYVKKIEKGAIPYSEKNGKKFSLSDFTQFEAIPSEGYLIGISMNFLNVHVNRAPIAGKVFVIRRIKGGFISLRKKEAVIRNERALTVIDNGYLKAGVVQIASRLVRKIVLYTGEGHEIERGQRIGMIRFGSQVDLILPSSPALHIEVEPEDNVRAGVSIVARIIGK